MSSQNRPYAVTDIITNLHGVVGKTMAVRVLTSLSEQNLLVAKTYGKTIIYVIKQNVDTSEVTTDTSENESVELAKELEKQVIALTSQVKAMKESEC